MTYCVALKLEEGLIFAADSRTNAGVDHVATVKKLHTFEIPNERFIVLLNSGNLATTQSVVSLLRQRLHQADMPNLHSVRSLYDAAAIVGATVREVLARDSSPLLSSHELGCSFLIGGQIAGETPRLFNIYPQGNFVEATQDTPYLQIGESKYGKPILDRVIQYTTPLEEAFKCALISFNSTLRSNISVGLPLDVLCMKNDIFEGRAQRIDENDPYFKQLGQLWSTGLRKVFTELPDFDWPLLFDPAQKDNQA